MLTRIRTLLVARRSRRDADAAARANRDRGTHCFYCDVAFGDEPGLDRTIDHRIARSHGGSDLLVNMVFACRACNERKADHDEGVFVESPWLVDRRQRLSQTDEGR